jgi:hypothetical protein
VIAYCLPGIGTLANAGDERDNVGMRKKERPPQEKKALSYARDRRNSYGENDKAARKLIPLRKAQESRQDRRKVAQDLGTLPRLESETADLVESSARQNTHRVGGWKKAPDVALGISVASGLEAREWGPGGKTRRRLAPERLHEIIDNLTTAVVFTSGRIFTWQLTSLT